MKVGDLVMMKGCEYGIIGCIVQASDSSAKIVWADDLCDPSWVYLFDLEAINGSR